MFVVLFADIVLVVLHCRQFYLWKENEKWSIMKGILWNASETKILR